MRKTTLFFLILLGIFLFRGVILDAYYSITSDEPVNYTGLALWKTGNFAHSPSHPPGIKLLMAFFLMPLNPNVPIPPDYPDNDEFLYGRLLIFQYNQQIFQKMINWGRFPTLLLGLLTMIYVYRWATELTNRKSALVATLLFAFFPLAVALSSIATNDMMVAAFFIMTMYYFKHFVQSGKTMDAVLTGICLGIALLGKHTGILLVPVLGIAAFCLMFTKQPLPALKFLRNEGEFTLKRKLFALAAFFIFIGAISAFVLNAGYLFQGTFTPLREYKFEQSFLALNNPAIGWIPVPLPFWYVKGLETNQIFFQGPHYFHGKWLTNEDWYFFIFSFLVKTPIPLLIMLVLSLGLCARFMKGKMPDLLLILLTVVGVTVFFSMKQYKLGLRHLLPIYPLLFVFIAGLWNYAADNHKVLKRTLQILLVWYLITGIIIHPNYLSYFNEFVGGSKNGYKYFLDSNVDWGQDLNGLKNWMNEHGVSQIGLSYFGNDIPQLRGINAHEIPCERTPGLHAVSVNNLYGLIFTGQPKDCYEWLRSIPPTDRVGHSIFIFDIPK